MNREAFWYYVPSLLRICVLDFYDADAIYETTLWHLTPSTSNVLPDEFEEFAGLLSQEQKEAIACGISYIAQHARLAGELDNLAERALIEYWERYTE